MEPTPCHIVLRPIEIGHRLLSARLCYPKSCSTRCDNKNTRLIAPRPKPKVVHGVVDSTRFRYHAYAAIARKHSDAGAVKLECSGNVMVRGTEADNPCTTKTPVCTLHLTLRTLHIALYIAYRRYSVNLELTKYLHLTKIITYYNRNYINSRYIFTSN